MSGDMVAKAWGEVRVEFIRSLRSRAAAHDRIAAMGGQDDPEVQRMLAEMGHPTYAQQAIAERALADQIEALTVPSNLGSRLMEITHIIADGEAVTSCCGRTPFELSRSERITVDPALVNCGAPSRLVTGLHAALTEAVETITTGIARSTRPGRDGFLLTSHLQQILDAHPETAPVISRDRLAGAILGEWMRHVEAQTRAAPIDHCLDYADAVIASGMFRSVDEVKAEALQEAAAAWDQADADGSIGDFADVHYLAGQNLPSLWLHHRADALTATPEGSDKA